MEEERKETVKEERPVLTWPELYREFMYTLRATLGEPLPPEFWQHTRNARKEALLAARSLIDARIAAIEQEERRRSSRPTKITVQ
jgi:hypothetical protein